MLLIRWDLRSDTFEHGQWFKGRIYERRCDLSPKGEKLIYFASDFKYPGFGSWTAVSKPPYLTALAVWPKGDCWGGGGLFDSEIRIRLNHAANEMELAEGFKLGKNVSVRPVGLAPGWGEDNPIFHTRLLRDGWTLLEEGRRRPHDPDSDMNWRFDEPVVYARDRHRSELSLRWELRGIHVRDGPWYLIEHRVVDGSGRTVVALPETNWADWDGNGDLLFAREGRLFRLPVSEQAPMEATLGSARELADFSGLTFQEKVAPREALRW